MKNTFTIGELAKEFDVTHRTLRFYEDKGLISPGRQGQNRLYSRRDRSRLKLVILGKKVGFPLAEIKEMLKLYDLKDGDVPQLRAALQRFGEQVAVLRSRRQDIEQAIEELMHTMDIVSGMLRDRQVEARSGPMEIPREAAE